METPDIFDADRDKIAKNFAERQLHLVEDAKRFEFETAVVVDDDRREYGEVRQVAIGFIGERMHVLVFTMRGKTCRSISLRKANKREIRRYDTATEQME